MGRDGGADAAIAPVAALLSLMLLLPLLLLLLLSLVECRCCPSMLLDRTDQASFASCVAFSCAALGEWAAARLRLLSAARWSGELN